MAGLVTSASSAKARSAELRRIGMQVRRLREAAGLTQSELADGAGVHRVTISKVENGRLDLGVSHLRALAGALGVSASALID
jgi:transcriptional regulator with XRE-family HTH domain